MPMIDQSTIEVLTYVLLVIGGGAILISFLKPMMTKNKKTKLVDIPRDALERVVKNSKKPLAHGFGANIRGKVKFSGDELVMGFNSGWIVAGNLLNEEYVLYIKKHWLFFWQKPMRVCVEPEVITDFNGEEIMIEGKGWEAIDEYHVYVVPCYGVDEVERINIYRSQNMLMRVLKIMIRPNQRHIAKAVLTMLFGI